LTGSLVLAGFVQAALALSILHLFKSSLTPTVDTTDVMFDAAEADYDGYAAKTITAWQAPGYAAVGGSSINCGYDQFNYVNAGPGVANSIGGFWLEDAAGAVILYGTFPKPYTMAVNGDIVPVEIVLNFGS